MVLVKIETDKFSIMYLDDLVFPWKGKIEVHMSWSMRWEGSSVQAMPGSLGEAAWRKIRSYISNRMKIRQ